MSAFIVTDATISGMLQATVSRVSRYSSSPCTYYYWNGEAHYFRWNMYQEIGQKLVEENYRSVNYRYSEKTSPHEYEHKEIRDLSALEIIKLCNCYNYQSCETDDWEQTEAHAIVNALRENAIANLPGYGDAEWDIHYV